VPSLKIMDASDIKSDPGWMYGFFSGSISTFLSAKVSRYILRRTNKPREECGSCYKQKQYGNRTNRVSPFQPTLINERASLRDLSAEFNILLMRLAPGHSASSRERGAHGRSRCSVSVFHHPLIADARRERERYRKRKQTRIAAKMRHFPARGKRA